MSPRSGARSSPCRRRALDRAIGRMARRATWAAGQIAKLGRDARSESVRLAALRAALSDMITVTKFAGLECARPSSRRSARALGLTTRATRPKGRRGSNFANCGAGVPPAGTGNAGGTPAPQ